MRAEPERDVAIGRTVQLHLAGPIELPLVVVGRIPADEDAVVAPQLLTAQLGVPTDGAAELLVDREVAQELVGGSAVQRRIVDQRCRRFG